MARGIVVFQSIVEARNAGYEIFDRSAEGYLARTRVDGLWALALVRARPGEG